MDRPYGAIVWKDLLPAWNWNRRSRSTPTVRPIDWGLT